MNLRYFPHFFRMNYPNVPASNEDLMEIGQEFKQYLEDIFKDNREKLEPIWDIEPKTIIPRIGHPFYMNGYHPVLIIHFWNFAEKIKNETTSGDSKA